MTDYMPGVFVFPLFIGLFSSIELFHRPVPVHLILNTLLAETWRLKIIAKTDFHLGGFLRFIKKIVQWPIEKNLNFPANEPSE